YINGLGKGLTNALIICEDSTKCKSISPKENTQYVSSTNESGLINCSNTECISIPFTSVSPNSYYINSGNDKSINQLIFCNEYSNIICKYVSSSKINPGYYMNSGKYASFYPLITCNREKCNALKIKDDIFPGFYINAGDDSKPIIICDESCYTTNVLDLQKKGGYKYSNSILGFYYNDTITPTNVTSPTTNLFFNIEINDKNTFPSINSINESKKTIFKVSKYSITRYSVDGILSISSDHYLATNEITLDENSEVYSCIKKSMTCNKITSCITNEFYLDVTSEVGYYCNSNILKPLTNEGYYIDGSRYVGKNTPYLFYCNNEFKCTSVNDTNQYYLNAGINYLSKTQINLSSLEKNNKNLIYCNGKNCNTITSSIGYYIAGVSHVDIYSNRLIYCNDNNFCNAPRPISIVASFINNGIDSHQKPLIHCNINTCITQSVTTGYFISENKNSLIHCEGNSCNEIKATSGYYYYGGSQKSKKYLIKCENEVSIDMVCELIEGEKGFYVSTTSNVLIDCVENKCKSIIAKNGVFRSANTVKLSSNSKRSLSRFVRRANSIYNLIICNQEGCHELSSEELTQVPICNYIDDKCTIVLPSSTSSIYNQITTINAGDYCTNTDHSQIYFATGSISVKQSTRSGETLLDVTSKNCLKVGKQYNSYYYIYGDIIYKLNEHSISQVFSDGYLFINTNTAMLASSDDINSYNNEKTKLYKCNENGCTIVKKPDSTMYITDINKKIIKYDVTTDSYSFMKDITCIYNNNNKCTPNTNMDGQSICITYKGEIVLISDETQSYESGECYKSSNINTNTYNYYKNLYIMNSNSAQLVKDASYYFINSITNTIANYKEFINGKNYSVIMYGCLMSGCNKLEPEEDIYYYSTVGKYLIKYEKGIWTSPQTSGYALVSINPNEVYIYKISVTYDNKVILENKVSDGFYYTIDEEMYECKNQNPVCEKISESGYYFTETNEMYYCLYDSEHIEKTVCYKQTCIPGQYYFIEYRYHRCEKNSYLNPVSPLYCFPKDKVIINFPIMYKDSMPSYIRKAIDNIENNNNSTAIIKSNNINNMNYVPGIFTNCTYNQEDDTTKFDLICISNFVEVKDKKDAKICSIENLGFIHCEEDKDNSEKCNASFAYPLISIHITTYTIIIILVTYLLFQ
ncbi:hypothetical protein BCR36DRAFT_301108, partial [Piromyces finnis]